MPSPLFDFGEITVTDEPKDQENTFGPDYVVISARGAAPARLRKAIWEKLETAIRRVSEAQVVAEVNRLSPDLLSIMQAIYEHEHANDEIPSVRQLASQLGTPVMTLHNRLDQLVRLGYLQRLRRGQGKARRWRNRTVARYPFGIKLAEDT